MDQRTRNVLRLTPVQAADIVSRFETDGGSQVTTDDVQLLERFFAESEGDEAQDLSSRYEAALRRFGVQRQ